MGLCNFQIARVEIAGVDPPFVLEVLAENGLDGNGCSQLFAETRSSAFL